MKKQKVLIIYHACDTGPARAIFNSIGSLESIHLRVLGPEKGWNSFRRIWYRVPRYQKEENYEIVSGKIIFPQKNCANPYLTGLIREVLHFNPDVIHVLNEVTSLVLFQVLIIRFVFFLKTKVLFWGAENLLDKKIENGSFFKKIIWYFNIKHVDGGGYVNTEGVQQLRSLGFSKKPVVVSYWGIDLEKFKKRNVENLLVEYDLKDKFKIGYIGRIIEEKGLSSVLNSMRELPQKVVFIVVGEGNYLETLIQEVKELGLEDRFYHFDSVDDFEVNKYISLLDVFILPSLTTETWKEQFGRVIAEAMSCSVPVIGSSSGAIPEVLQGAGYIFQEGDYVDLADKIKKYMYLTDMEKKEIQIHCLEVARKYYSTEVFAGKFNKLYKDVLEKNENWNLNMAT